MHNRKMRALKLRKKLVLFKKKRLFFNKTNKYIYIYIIDDDKKKIIFSESTYQFKHLLNNCKNLIASKKLADKLLIKLKNNNISSILFDRSGYKYHGCIKNIADILILNQISFK